MPKDSSISCGNGIAADLSAARAENDKTGKNIPIIGEVLSGGTDYVVMCESALSARRSWTIPLAAVGAVAIVGALVVGRTAAEPRLAQPVTRQPR